MTKDINAMRKEQGHIIRALTTLTGFSSATEEGMRRFITGTGRDDAIALMMMLLSDDVQVEAVMTVCGNIGLEQVTLNALAI